MAKSKKLISAAEVQSHKKRDDCWIVVEGQVYDMTKFAPEREYFTFLKDMLVHVRYRETRTSECYQVLTFGCLRLLRGQPVNLTRKVMIMEDHLDHF